MVKNRACDSGLVWGGAGLRTRAGAWFGILLGRGIGSFSGWVLLRVFEVGEGNGMEGCRLVFQE